MMSTEKVNKAFETEDVDFISSSRVEVIKNTKKVTIDTTNKSLDNIKTIEHEIEESVSQKSDSDFEYKEGGWGWVVVMSAGYCFGIIFGMSNNYALLLNELTVVYKQAPNNVVYAGKNMN